MSEKNPTPPTCDKFFTTNNKLLIKQPSTKLTSPNHTNMENNNVLRGSRVTKESYNNDLDNAINQKPDKKK
jgi:hypothetical protein